MRTHRQSTIEYGYSERTDTLTQHTRTNHTALSVKCPRCEAGRGFPCKQGNTAMPRLAVHVERQEASL